MSEIVLKIGGTSPSPLDYQDGDILQSFSRRRIRNVHAEHICLPKLEGGELKNQDGDGVLPYGSLEEEYCKATHELKFERISDYEMRITRLSDMAEVVFQSNVVFANPFDNGILQKMDIPMISNKMRLAKQKPVFGVVGRETWYGGNLNYSHVSMDKVWQKIEFMTPNIESDFTLFPLSNGELKSFLALPVTDFSDETYLESPELDVDEKTVLKKRKFKVDWKSLDIGVPMEKVLDKSFSVDVRKTVPPFDINTLPIPKSVVVVGD